ncbi:MFS transporter [Pseudomonas agarici]|uniref:MFS transporter n=1 Tax=Pseudomonas agarici TaxID=46677 RepID=A0A0X1T249_PSEAA|nr:MFS transporter [Pseudomonas agarici]AMB86132.1 MFS transporter [Pseudomonas agarici]NWB94000.1 MFS transporter [Pseudomonas agarici]NWC10493.1 MFS transporter [Pseudomonas agarici]SEL39575.1 Predicted arabinose efflux permease, MFS family [Pseudomonas agarici]
MKFNGQLALAIALLMFPQIAQSIFSPALADIERVLEVGVASASRMFSVYFLAFAFGVVVWGLACDWIGRRPSLLAGLVVYLLAICLALSTTSFSVFLISQAFAAFGVAACSVVTQTVLRDSFRGTELAQVFSLVGMALAASPAIGLFTGASLVAGFGYHGVLYGLLGLALLLFGVSARQLSETRPTLVVTPPLFATSVDLFRDLGVWRSALLVAAFNIALFSYYSLAPFMFQRLGLGGELFGYSGVILALGSGCGAWLNKRLLHRGWAGERLVGLASRLMLGAGVAVWGLQDSGLFVLPMMAIVLGFGLAIPNILGGALAAYSDRQGTAGALFGLMYYLMIGAGLMGSAWSQDLGASLLFCGATAWVLTFRWRFPRGGASH